jgi:hypothetical protein
VRLKRACVCVCVCVPVHVRMCVYLYVVVWLSLEFFFSNSGESQWVFCFPRLMTYHFWNKVDIEHPYTLFGQLLV